MNRESASVIIHFRDGGAEELLKEILDVDVRARKSETERLAEVGLTNAEMLTIVEALNYLAMAMEAAEFPCGYVDDLAERLQTMLDDMEG